MLTQISLMRLWKKGSAVVQDDAVDRWQTVTVSLNYSALPPHQKIKKMSETPKHDMEEHFVNQFFYELREFKIKFSTREVYFLSLLSTWTDL